MRRNYQHDFPVNSLAAATDAAAAAAAARVVFKRRALTAERSGAAARDGKGIAWRHRIASSQRSSW